jgi:hypothetical protein
MTDAAVQFAFEMIHDAWAREVMALGGNPEEPTADEERLLLLRELQLLGPEIVYGKATWAAMKELDASEGAEG